MKILWCGDTHGDIENIVKALEYACLNDCTIVFILGDFGYFPNLEKYGSFIREVSKEAKRFDIEVHWLRGNHENHEALNRICKGKTDTIEMEPNVFYHPNANSWRWDGITFLAMGGAYSIDKAYRKLGRDWFPGEVIAVEDTYKACGLGQIDVVLSHDSPISSNLDDFLDFYLAAETQANRHQLQGVIEAVRPKINFHGHYHTRFQGKGSFNTEDGIKEFDTICLDCHGIGQYYIFDTKLFRKDYNIA